MLRSVKVYLQDMVDAMNGILAFTRGITKDEFDANEQLQAAVLFKLVVLGEAASKVPNAIRAQFPGITWREVVGMRNVVAHGYFDVRVDIVWTAITVEIPAIKAALGDIGAMNDDGTRATP